MPQPTLFPNNPYLNYCKVNLSEFKNSMQHTNKISYLEQKYNDSATYFNIINQSSQS